MVDIIGVLVYDLTESSDYSEQRLTVALSKRVTSKDPAALMGR